jgi:two-component system nitrogen regulation response regulator NtrX
MTNGVTVANENGDSMYSLQDLGIKKFNKILIIDDDAEVRSLMAGVLSDERYVTDSAANEQEALASLKRSMPNLIFLDLWIGEDESGGFKILEKIKNINPNIPVIIISGHGTVDIAVNAVRNGAFDFIEKPFVIERLLITAQRALELYKLRYENVALRSKKLYSDVFAVGTSLFATTVQSLTEKIAISNSRVYINAPAGVGAENVAWQIHNKSRRNNQNFVYVNCISEENGNFDEELFGSEKTYGYLENASDGTVFLEDIDKLSKNTQRKLLMFLQNGKYQSKSRIISSSARIICSSYGKNIMKLIASGEFSSELFYRLKISEINIPPIKERREDIVPIIRYYMDRAEFLFGLQPKSFTDSALAILQSYEWPGNIRQIRNLVESSLINSGACLRISDSHLPPEVLSNAKEKFESLNIAKFISMPLKDAKDYFESDYLKAQIERFSGNISRTAIFIGMERSALHRKLKNLNIHCEKASKKRKKAGAAL